MSTIQQSLRDYFGYDTFRPGQEQAVNILLEGRSAAAIFPTGSGKSLIYQLAALHLPHLTLVVSPLLALISDQLEAMERYGIPAARIDSTLDHRETVKIREKVVKGEIKVLMVSVERFKNENFRNFLSGVSVSLLVVDEAHCISEWGHNFRPDYLKLPHYRKEFRIPQVLLLTATATPQVIEDMCGRFEIHRKDVVITGFYRPNLHLDVVPVAQADKGEKLVEILGKAGGESAIVYVTLQKTAEDIAAFLRSRGITAAAYHAGMNKADRELIQNAFMFGQIPVIVATIAFGMGIDKPDIRYLIHYDLPKSLESYSQEIGRAGRDGHPSQCILLGNTNAVNILENFVYGDTPERPAVRALIAEIASAGKRWEMSILKLSNTFNIRQLPLKTLLVYLEMEDFLRPLYSYYASYRFRFLTDSGQILEKFDGERREFLKAVFDLSKKARLWVTVDFEAILAQYPADRSRVVAALDYLSSQGYIELEVSDLIEVYEVNSEVAAPDALATLIYSRFEAREGVEMQRLKNMVAFFEGDRCLSKALSEYFGETTDWESCGHCSVCLDGSRKLVNDLHLEPLTPGIVKDKLQELLVSHGDAGFSPQSLARFLCGIYTPLFGKLRLSSVPGFGALENYRYDEVLRLCTSL